MPQPIRQTSERPKAFWETVQERINTAKAVELINTAMDGDEEISPQQERCAMFTIRQFCPALQAVAVDITDNRPASAHDLLAQAMNAGIDTRLLFGGQLPLEGDSKRTESKSNGTAHLNGETPGESASEPSSSIDSSTRTPSHEKKESDA